MLVLSHNELNKIGYKNKSKDKLLNIVHEKKQARKNKIKGVAHTPSKNAKKMKKTIELFYTP